MENIYIALKTLLLAGILVKFEETILIFRFILVLNSGTLKLPYYNVSWNEICKKSNFIPYISLY